LYKYIKENRKVVLVFPLVLYWIAILVGTSLPADMLVDEIEISDKIIHFGAYLGLAVLLGFNLHFQEKWNKIKVYYIILAFLICVLYGVADELHQLLVPNRSADFFDWVADALGALTGILSASFFIEKIKKKYVAN